METGKVNIQLPEGITQEQFESMFAKFQTLREKSKELPSGEPVIFKEILSKENEVIRVYRDVYKGKEYLSVRKFWRKDSLEDYQPGKGITFIYDDIDEIISGLEDMKLWCEDHLEEVQ